MVEVTSRFKNPKTLKPERLIHLDLMIVVKIKKLREDNTENYRTSPYYLDIFLF